MDPELFYFDMIQKKKIAVYSVIIFLWIIALSFFVMTMGVQAFREPLGEAPVDIIAPPLHTGGDTQIKYGKLGAKDFFIDNLGVVAGTVVPEFRHKTVVLSSNKAAVFCDPGFFLLSCYGSRELSVSPTCPEAACTFFGTAPIDALGNTSYRSAVGCKAGIFRQTASEEAVVQINCVKWR